MRNEIGRIRQQLRNAIEGGAWHGPALREIIGDLTPGEAARRPLPAAHAPWEIAAHVAVWLEIVARRLAGEAVEPATAAEDWPPMAKVGAAEWALLLERIDAAHARLQNALGALGDADLERTVPGRTYDAYHMLHGAIQHTLYHAGQIAILKKAIRSKVQV